MNAEIHIDLDVTAELDVEGVTLTVFIGDDSDGEVVCMPFSDLIEDLFELCTIYDDGIAADDVEYMKRVAQSLEAAALEIKSRLGVT